MRKYFVAFLLLILVGCQTMHLKQQTIGAFMQDAKVKEVKEIIILNGETGEKKTITDAGKIEQFLDDIEDILFTPDDNQQQRDGFRYAVKLVDGEHSLQFTTNSVGQDYYVTEEPLFEVIDALFQSQ